MKFNPDNTIFWEYGFLHINLTMVTTWFIIFVLTFGAWLITRNLKSELKISRWQSALEIIVIFINTQIKEIGLDNSEKYIGFIGTLFLFIGFSNLCIILPGYTPPTASLSTTAALALSVFLAVPFFGIKKRGFIEYLKTYIRPVWVMLPLNIISEISRTLALAIRLFGNIMSGGMIVAILLSISPFIFPVVMNVLGLLTGMVQAYIYSILATVYIAGALQSTGSNRKINLKHQKNG
jgi:F-type H+-transporting ATPase subunit a